MHKWIHHVVFVLGTWAYAVQESPFNKLQISFEAGPAKVNEGRGWHYLNTAAKRVSKQRAWIQTIALTFLSERARELGPEQSRNCGGTFIILLLSQEMKILLMSVIYKQGSRQNRAFHELRCTAWGGQGRKRWVDTGYCVWFARLLVLIELHFTFILENKFPFRLFHNEE